MSVQNLVSATISEESKQSVLTKLEEIKKELGFLITLQPDEIQCLIKAGNGFAPFLDQAYGAVVDHPDIMPAVFNAEEFKRDYQLSKDISAIARQANELADTLNNTLLAVNSDAFTGSLDVYAAVKQNRNKVPGLNVVAENMSEFFKKSRKKTPASTAN